MAIDVDAILGFGSVLSVDRGSGYEVIAGLTEIGDFGAEADEVERTTHGSPGGWRRFARGLVDPGSLTFSGYWVAHPTQLDLVEEQLGDFVYEAEYPYRITLPNGMGQWDANGFLKTSKINPQMDGNLEFNGEIRLSGQPSFSVEASDGFTTPFFDVSDADTITPDPSADDLIYVAVVATGISSVTVTPTAVAGVIRVNSGIVTSGSPSTAIALGAAGSITPIRVSVKETGLAAKDYTINVVRLAA